MTSITTTTATLSHSHPSSFSRLLSFSPARASASFLRLSAIPGRGSASLSLSLPIRRCSAADSEQAPLTFGPDPEEIKDVYLESDVGSGGGGEDGGGGEGFGSGGGDQGGEGEGGSSSEGENKKMSMSQKLTLGYAALVAIGGVMGYIKSRSQKSLAAGGSSALLLYYIYTQLPVRPAFASSLGLGLSAALLTVMGSRFRKSRKIFPAGVVSLVSLIMAGGYFHGILRSLHA